MNECLIDGIVDTCSQVFARRCSMHNLLVTCLDHATIVVHDRHKLELVEGINSPVHSPNKHCVVEPDWLPYILQ